MSDFNTIDSYYDEECYNEQQHSSPMHLYKYTDTDELSHYDYETKNTNKFFLFWHFSFKSSGLSPQLEKQFNDLAKKWEKETAIFSSTLHITRNDHYLDIIGMGKEVVPLILKELQREPQHWFVALKAITKENPIRREHFGNIEKMRQDWLEWGKKNKLI